MNRYVSLLLFCLGFILAIFVLQDRYYAAGRKSESEIRKAAVEKFHAFRKNPKTLITIKRGFRHFDCKQVRSLKTEFSSISRLEDFVPYELTPGQTKKWGQDINSKAFAMNAIALSCHGGSISKIKRDIYRDKLIERLAKWTTKTRFGFFFRHQYKYKPLDYDLSPGWLSGFAQGQILVGLVLLNSVGRTQHIEYLIQQFALSYRLGSPTVFLDSNGQYWIDEYPGEAAKSYVLNGHIWGLMGLYYIWDYDLSKDYERELKGAIQTIHNSWKNYRLRGLVNCYDMRICEPDYDPWRAGRQMRWLYEMSGEYSFLDGAALFDDDAHAVFKRKGDRTECKKNVISKLNCFWRFD